MAERRNLPSVDRLSRELDPRWPERVRIAAAREAVEAVRTGLAEDVVAEACKLAIEKTTMSVCPMLNASGVLLHTGLGRARLARVAAEAVASVASGFANVELDLGTGRRGDRQDHVRDLLRELTGAEDALVVNNNAGAVMLALAAISGGKEVILSRGQMVEIGGAYRMPDVIAASGAKLKEVGCTNRTHLRDYAEAIHGETGALLICHRSNFTLSGFVSDAPPPELAELAHRRSLPLLDDLGSGCLLDLTAYGLPPERTVQAALHDGADLVMASGDKLLGGPQAGLLVGRSQWIARCKAHPMARALRIDKLTLAALEATLRLYTTGQVDQIPFYSALRRPLQDLKEAAGRLALAWPGAVMEASTSEIGGGSLPGTRVPTWRVGVRGGDDLARRLRLGEPGVLTRVEDDRVWFDLRTLEPSEIPLLERLVQEALIP